MHFESKYSEQYNFYIPFITGNANYPEHFHADYELFYCIDGEIMATISGNGHKMTKGDFALVFPNQAHSYVATPDAKCFVCIFSSDMVESFTRLTSGKLPSNPIFTLEDMSILHALIMYRKKNTILLQSHLYYICSQFLEQCPLQEVLPQNLILQNQIADYVSKNFTKPLTLHEIAKTLGYNYQYLSRFFSQNYAMNFRSFLNQYRIDYAMHILDETKESITSIALSCGFDNSRSFNRAFLQKNGITPSAYRIRHLTGI